MAGYSGTPLRVKSRATGPLDDIVFFVTRRRELERRFERLMAAMDPAGGFWVSWPKGTSGVETDMTEDDARDVGVAHGLVDNGLRDRRDVVGAPPRQAADGPLSCLTWPRAR
jgi:hypothetical protein